MTDHNYLRLKAVLEAAFDQAAHGKGQSRHSTGQDFADQPMQAISRLIGSHHGLIYQAVKKAQESTRMESGPAIAELLGAIVYLAGAVIYLEDGKQ